VLAGALHVPVPTSTQTTVVAAALPETPLTVMSYVPRVVPVWVAAVSVEVCADVLLKVSELGERLHVVGSVALEGVVVTEQLSVTVPVKELPGVTVMVEVPVEPGLTLMLPLLESVKLLLLLLPGACQKFPQPATSGAAASNNHDHFPIFITTTPVSGSSRCTRLPLKPLSDFVVSRPLRPVSVSNFRPICLSSPPCSSSGCTVFCNLLTG
jgi:hypothetical protein